MAETFTITIGENGFITDSSKPDITNAANPYLAVLEVAPKTPVKIPSGQYMCTIDNEGFITQMIPARMRITCENPCPDGVDCVWRMTPSGLR